jgi:hypothetical protein
LHGCTYSLTFFFVVGRHKKPDSEKVKKPGVSLTPECQDILSKIIRYEFEVNQTDMKPSQAIRKCMRIAWDYYYKADYERRESKGHPLPQGASTNIVRTPSGTYDGGLLTPKTANSLQAGKGK